MTSLERILGGIEVTIGYDACQDNPCNNAGKCSTTMKVKQETVIVEAEDIIFNSPMFEEVVACDCPDNFEGSSCQLKSNPCEGGAQCIQEGYDFQCICPQQRTGKRCEIQKKNSCLRNPCENGG